MDLIYDFDPCLVFQLSLWENKNIFVIHLYFLFNISIISNWEKIIRPLSGHGICRNLNNRILKMEEIYLCSFLQVG